MSLQYFLFIITITCFVQLSHARLRAEIKVLFIHPLLCSPSTSLCSFQQTWKNPLRELLQFGLSIPRMENTRIYSFLVLVQMGNCCAAGLLSPGEQGHPSVSCVTSPVTWKALLAAVGSGRSCDLQQLGCGFSGGLVLFLLGCCSSGTHRSWMKPPQFLSQGIGFSVSSQHNK